MARVSTYLNFEGQAEEAFALYASVFGTEPAGPIARMGDMPPEDGQPPLGEDEGRYVMHMELPITSGHVLMATDFLPSQGHQLRVGNNTTICIEVDDRAEVDRLHGRLSGGTEAFGPADMPWGAYWGVCLDPFGVRWMFSHTG